MEDFDTYNPALDEKTLATIKQWYDNSSEAGRKVIYFLENGGEDIIYGMGTIAIGSAMGKNARDYAKEEHPDKYDERYEQQGSESKGEGGATNAGKDVVFGSGTKSTQKLTNQMTQRGWTEDLVRGTVDRPYTTRVSINKATGNPASVYYNKQGAYVIIDDVTKSVVQVGDNINPSTWAPDMGIVDPYIPK